MDGANVFPFIKVFQSEYLPSSNFRHLFDVPLMLSADTPLPASSILILTVDDCIWIPPRTSPPLRIHCDRLSQIYGGAVQ